MAYRAVLAPVLVAAALAGGSAAQGAPAAGSGIEVSGNHLTTLSGTTVRLLGVDRSSGEYMCVNHGATTVWSGPTNAASIAAMTSWHVNAVRLPLNEDCWLGINGVNPRLGGAQYRLRVKRYVDALNAAGLYVILDLHWAAPGKILATEQWPMADATHAPAFWRSVGRAFRGDRAVLFDLFNEPFISSWPCWEDGCSTEFTDSAHQNITYRTAGMQQLVNAVRSSGARNPLMLGGLGYAGDESQWTKYEPNDPDHQLIVSYHTYNFAGCTDAACWQQTIGAIATTTPVVTGEFGENDCGDSYSLAYMNWADAHGVSYLAWAWDATDSGWSCSGGPALIVNYAGTPTPYGVGLQSHLAALASANAASVGGRRARVHFVK
ncbi:MAG TPA: cellulase family glycosylhydrolase [Solirubrobacteraceae bacterium]|nr:cellulase family glycosylhydrolase [Solirubrobacteraceae bacterium]